MIFEGVEMLVGTTAVGVEASRASTPRPFPKLFGTMPHWLFIPLELPEPELPELSGKKGSGAGAEAFPSGLRLSQMLAVYTGVLACACRLVAGVTGSHCNALPVGLPTSGMPIFPNVGDAQFGHTGKTGGDEGLG
mmetsp:Transcript_76734/g.138444  ORF Transcript_76734/g.138444 Transcript_76734/m.138444 type:complete len:135 (-) Transcript_76734:314-718(-)